MANRSVSVVAGATLAFTKLVVSDIDVSIQWYADVLGMTPVQRVEFASPDATEVVMADVAGPKLVLMSSQAMPVQSGLPTWTPMAFMVEDARAAAEAIRAAGHELLVYPALELGPTAITIAVDPDGYLIELISTVPTLSDQIDVGVAGDGGKIEHPIPALHHRKLK